MGLNFECLAKGIEEARIGGRALKVKGLIYIYVFDTYSMRNIPVSGISFDVAFTSMLKRAIQTLFYIQEEIDQHYIPVKRYQWRTAPCNSHARFLGAGD